MSREGRWPVNNALVAGLWCLVAGMNVYSLVWLDGTVWNALTAVSAAALAVLFTWRWHRDKRPRSAGGRPLWVSWVALLVAGSLLGAVSNVLVSGRGGAWTVFLGVLAALLVVVSVGAAVTVWREVLRRRAAREEGAARAA